MKWSLLTLLVLMTSCALNGWKNSPGSSEQEKRYNEIKGYHLSGRHVFAGIMIDDYLKKYQGSEQEHELRYWDVIADMKSGQDREALKTADAFLEKYPESEYSEEIEELKEKAEKRYHTFERHFVFSFNLGRSLESTGENPGNKMSVLGGSYFFTEKVAIGFDFEDLRLEGKDSQFETVDASESNKDINMLFYTPTLSYRHFVNMDHSFTYKVGLGFGMNSLPERYEEDGSDRSSSFAISQKLYFNYCYLNREKVKCWDGDKISFGFFHYQFTSGGIGNFSLEGDSVWGLMFGLSG